MAHLKCKKHGRRSQVSEYLIGGWTIERILHRSDKTRCDGNEVVINNITFEAETVISLSRNNTQHIMNSI